MNNQNGGNSPKMPPNDKNQNNKNVKLNEMNDINIKKIPVKRFNYTAKDSKNRVIKDYHDSENIDDTKSFLQSQGLTILSIKEDKLSSKLGLVGMTKEMKLKDLAFFLTQLSTYIKSGIPLVDAMNILSRQNKKYRRVYTNIVFRLYKGITFSRCLMLQGKTFPKMLINMVQTSELTGNLTEVLDEMADYYKQKDTTRKQIVSAMTYPSILLIFTVCILAFVIMYIVPTFVDLYDSIDGELPVITQIVMTASDIIITYRFIILAAIILIVFLTKVLYSNINSFRYFIQRILMHIPVIKNMIINNEIIMFTSTFASLLKYDVFITDSMEILGKISNNEIYKGLIRDSVRNLSNGEGLAPAFKGHWAFPEIAYEMLVTGEKTGKLGPMMEQVSKFYQEEQTNITTRLKSLIEPLMIILLAVLVGVILISVVYPMFSMYGELIS